MSILPDELWTKILELGTSTSQLTYRDLCSVSIACRRLHRLSRDRSLWSTLLSLDFPNPSSSSSSDPPSKSLYRLRFERDKARRHAAWRREILIAESNVAVCKKRLGELEGLILKESERLKAARVELNNLEIARQASVALNIWQPEVIRGRQKQVVEQCTVPVESRLSSNDQKEKLKEGQEALKSLKYHPLQSYQSGATAKDCNRKRKKLKQISKLARTRASSTCPVYCPSIVHPDGHVRFIQGARCRGQVTTSTELAAPAPQANALAGPMAMRWVQLVVIVVMVELMGGKVATADTVLLEVVMEDVASYIRLTSPHLCGTVTLWIWYSILDRY